jgi:hypothetical protein
MRFYKQKKKKRLWKKQYAIAQKPQTVELHIVCLVPLGLDCFC